MYNYNGVVNSWMGYLGRLPALLLALLVLLIGWLVAGFAAKAVRSALRKTNFDNKMSRWMTVDGAEERGYQQSRTGRYSPEAIVSKTIFFLILALAFIVFFNMLNLPYVALPLSNTLGVITAAVPNILKAVLIAVAGWLIASLLAFLVKRGGRRAGIGRLMARWNMVNDPIDADRTIDSASKAVFYFTLLLFLPAVLASLGINAISEPLKGMLLGLFAFLPKLIGAAVILLVGWIVAKVVKEIITNFLRSIGTDHLAKRLGLESLLAAGSLSSIIGTICYVLVLLPTVISVLETLNIRGISDPAIGMLHRIMNIIPNAVIALLLVAAGIWIGKWVNRLVTGLLDRVGFNSVFRRMGFGSFENTAETMTLAQITGYIAQVIVVLLFTVEALQLVGLTSLVAILTVVLAYVPMVLTAVIILGLGFYVGHLVKRIVTSMVQQRTEGKFLANAAKYTIIALAFFMALDQLGVAKTIVNAAFILILGGFTIAFGLAFGLGGREFAHETLNKLNKRMENTTITKPDPKEWKYDNSKLSDFNPSYNHEMDIPEEKPAEQQTDPSLYLDKPHTVSRDRQFYQNPNQKDVPDQSTFNRDDEK